MNHYLRRPHTENPDHLSWCGIKLDPNTIVDIPPGATAPHICLVCADLDAGYVPPT